MENGIDPLEEFHARILALERLQGLQAFPWYATALELVFRLIHFEKIEPRKIYVDFSKLDKLIKKNEDRFFINIPRSFYPCFEFQFVPEMKRDAESILRVARKMEEEGWLKIETAYRYSPYTALSPCFSLRALRLVKMERKPQTIKFRDGSSIKYTPPPREPRRKRKN